MGVKDWEREYYPTTAESAATDDATAVEHSLTKWRGLRPGVLVLFQIEFNERHLVPLGIKPVDTEDKFKVDCKTCALCELYRDTCDGCPLYEVRDGVACDNNTEQEAWNDERPPFLAFSHDKDPEPMIQWLEKAKEFVASTMATHQPEVPAK